MFKSTHFPESARLSLQAQAFCQLRQQALLDGLVFIEEVRKPLADIDLVYIGVWSQAAQVAIVAA